MKITGGYTYIFTLKNILFSARFTSEKQNIFIICHNLNSAKKALFNTKRYNILALANLNEIKNWHRIKEESIYVNANFTDSHYPDKADHLAFLFKATTPGELLELSCELLDDKAKPIKFASDEQKVPIFDFTIDILK